MFWRAALVWFGIMLTAILNGAVRDIVMTARMGDTAARALSCVTLAGAIVVITFLTVRWMSPASMRDAWAIGAMWLVMTLLFEFGAGHYVFHTPWERLMADYNLLRGRLWILVLMTTLTAPALVYRSAQNPPAGMEISSAVPDNRARS